MSKMVNFKHLMIDKLVDPKLGTMVHSATRDQLADFKSCVKT
jgi:hypothetical protein